MGGITSPRSADWTNALEAQNKVWVELLVLEAWVGQMLSSPGRLG